MARLKACTRKLSWLAGALLLTGCARHPAETPDERLRRQAAEDARQVHHDVKAAGQEARQALSAAGRETKDIVAGAREGWREGAAKDGPIAPSAHAADINRASAAELTHLPGVSAATARRIVRGRPYADPHDLVQRGVLTENEFARVRDRITAR